MRPQAHTPVPERPDAPTTARLVGLPPRGGQYFLSKRKKVPKKASGTALREKGFYCPFCRRGSLCRAQHDWPDFTCNPARSELAFFRHQNGRAFFPPLPIAALAPRSRRKAYATLADWDALAWWGQFSRAVGWRILETMLACGASRETFRRATVCISQLAGNHTRPASREACRRAAVKPRPTRMSLYAPARHRRAVRG